MMMLLSLSIATHYEWSWVILPTTNGVDDPAHPPQTLIFHSSQVTDVMCVHRQPPYQTCHMLYVICDHDMMFR